MIVIDALKTIIEYEPEIMLVLEAISKGVSREAIRLAVRRLVVEASDAEMKRKYPNEEG